MSAALRAFLSASIDYAGMFPPACLSMEQAVRNYVAYQQDRDSWMLGRFIVPATKLHELAVLYPRHFKKEQKLLLSVLLRGGDTTEAILQSVEEDFRSIRCFFEKMNGQRRIVADIVECRLPGNLNAGQMKEALQGLREKADEVLPRVVRPFVEFPLTVHWKEKLPLFMETIQSFNDSLANEPSYHMLAAGFKLRCGGVEANAFPTVEQVANVLHQCIEHQVAFKATAGLHHPLRRYDQQLQTYMHGFINLFGAGLLALTHGTDLDRTVEILADEDPFHFRFDGTEFCWKGWHVGCAEIERWREWELLSFGSCSFDEPRQDLRALGWL